MDPEIVLELSNEVDMEQTLDLKFSYKQSKFDQLFRFFTITYAVL